MAFPIWQRTVLLKILKKKLKISFNGCFVIAFFHVLMSCFFFFYTLSNYTLYTHILYFYIDVIIFCYYIYNLLLLACYNFYVVFIFCVLILCSVIIL